MTKIMTITKANGVSRVLCVVVSNELRILVVNESYDLGGGSLSNGT
jgi:hypothetical protein